MGSEQGSVSREVDGGLKNLVWEKKKKLKTFHCCSVWLSSMSLHQWIIIEVESLGATGSFKSLLMRPAQSKARSPGVGDVCNLWDRYSQGKKCNLGPSYCRSSAKLHTHSPCWCCHSKAEHPLQILCCHLFPLKFINHFLHKSNFLPDSVTSGTIAMVSLPRSSTAEAGIYLCASK